MKSTASVYTLRSDNLIAQDLVIYSFLVHLPQSHVRGMYMWHPSYSGHKWILAGVRGTMFDSQLF